MPGVRYERGGIHDYDPTNVAITSGSIKNIDDPVDMDGVGDVGFNDARYRDVYKNIYIDAAEMIPCTTNGALQGTNEYGANDIDIDYLAFDGGAIPKRIQFKRKMEGNWDGGTIRFKLDWSSVVGSISGDTIELRIKAGARSDDEVIDAVLGTRVVINDTLLADDGADWQITPPSPALTVANSPAGGKTVIFEIDRNGPGSDTMGEKLWLKGVTMQIKLSGAVAAW